MSDFLYNYRRREHLCVDCGEPAQRKGKWWFVRCEECRTKLLDQQAHADKSQSICWSCQNAVPSADGSRGCEWSIKKQPVEGWTAQESWQTAIHGEKLRSYKVLSCPKYKEDE